MASTELKQRGSTLASQVKAEATQISNLGKEAITSYGWLYPIKGAFYFLSHPNLYRAVSDKLWSVFLLSVGVLAFLAIFTYLPQAAFLALFSGPLGFIAAIPLILTEAFIVISFVARLWYIDPVLEDLFDAVLIEQGQVELVSRGREITPSSSTGGLRVATKLGKRLTKPLERLSPSTLARYIVMLPLNAIPGVGTGLYLLYNGRKSGPTWHGRYYELKGLKGTEKDAFVKRNQAAYTAFGALALGLNLIPIVGFLTAFTTTVGAAIWAADLERGAKGTQDTQAPEQQTEVEFGEELEESERREKRRDL